MSLNILMINPPVRLHDKPRHIPHGLAILANVIRRECSIDPVFLDLNAHRYDRETYLNMLREKDYDIVLIGGIVTVYGKIIDIAKDIKNIKPDVPIVVGGYVAMSLPEVLLQNSLADVVCTGQGEKTIVALLKRYAADGLHADLSGIKGIFYKDDISKQICKNPEQDLIVNLDEESAFPAYDLLPMEIYLSNPAVGLGRDIDMITIRGCPYLCTFCYQPYGKAPRAHSNVRIASEIKSLKEKYSIDFVSFQDDEFMVNKKDVIEFCNHRNQDFPDLLWSCTGRANLIANDDALVKLMKSSGCVSISCGFESGSPRMLANMRKMQTIEQMEKTIQVLRANDLPVPVSFIIGMPGETMESTQETLDFCLRNTIPLDSLMFATPYPGAEIFNFAVRTNRIDINLLHDFALGLGDARDFFINLTDDFSDDALIARRTEMMRIARDKYEKEIRVDEIVSKTRNLFGPLFEKAGFDAVDLEHRAKHGGMSIF